MSTATKIVDKTNSVIDAVQALADSPLIGLIGLVIPQANSVIDVIRRYRSTIDAAQPIIKQAVEAGEPVIEKVVEQLPKFATVVSSMMAFVPQNLHNDIGAGMKAENIARVIGGFGRMTPEQEMAWMNRMTPGNDPSQENSKYPIG